MLLLVVYFLDQGGKGFVQFQGYLVVFVMIECDLFVVNFFWVDVGEDCLVLYLFCVVLVIDEVEIEFFVLLLQVVYLLDVGGVVVLDEQGQVFVVL